VAKEVEEGEGDAVVAVDAVVLTPTVEEEVVTEVAEDVAEEGSTEAGEVEVETVVAAVVDIVVEGVEEVEGDEVAEKSEYSRTFFAHGTAKALFLTSCRPRDNIIPQPSTEVTEVEDLFMKNSNAPLSIARLSLGNEFPVRPAYGDKGQPVTLWTNYFELKPSLDLVLYRYAIEVMPNEAGKKLSQIVRLLMSERYDEFREDIVSDYKSNLVSRVPLGDGVHEIVYRAEGEDEPKENARRYRVRVQGTGTLTLASLMDYLSSTTLNTAFGGKSEIITGLNILLGDYAKSSPKVTIVGSQKVFSLTDNPPHDLRGGLSVLRGFFTSVRAATSRILVNVNVTYGVFYDAVPLGTLLRNYGRTVGNNPHRIESFINRLRVKVIHLKEKKDKDGTAIPRVKTIFGLARMDDGHALEHPPRVSALAAGAMDTEFYLNPTSAEPSATPSAPATKPKGKKGGKGGGGGAATAASLGGRYISVYDYFLKTYKLEIEFPNMPVINVGNRENPSYLPVDACIVLPGQAYRKKADPSHVAEMSKFTVRPPVDNANSIANDGINTVGIHPQANPKLARFGVSVSTKLITVPGRVLTAPAVVYRNNSRVQAQNGSWNLIKVKFATSGKAQTWTSLPLQLGEDFYHDCRDVVLRFHKTISDTMGILISPPSRVGEPVTCKSPTDPVIERHIAAIANAGIKLVLIILSSKNTQLYNHVKLLGDVRYGVHTVCVTADKFIKDQIQYQANVALKFNLKLGGNNHSVESPGLKIIGEDKTMIVGIDVTHPPPGSAGSTPSVASMVASIDKALGQWPADLRVQEGRKEMVSDLNQMLKSRLRLWKTAGKHQAFPENILVYRDGVSEGQYSTVLATELPLLREACKEVYPAPDTKKGLPNISIIVVGKRHHTRFYPTKVSDADNNSNCKNGTVVDRGVTESSNWDFFMQAHTALKGTARPAHYYVILDEIFRGRRQDAGKNHANTVEELTHSLCYYFGRATKAVSICPAAYYADIVCDRAKRYIDNVYDASPSGSVLSGGQAPEVTQNMVTIHPNLRDTMFYI
jgi:eukaryotic translation initiation factor 2C